MKYRILVSTYAGSSNKGAEALLRGLSYILDSSIGKENIDLSMSSIQPKIDATKDLPLYKHFYQRFSIYLTGYRGKFIRLLARVSKRLNLPDLEFFFQHYELLNAVRHQDLFIEMGADNYDIEYGDGYKLMYKMHSWIRKHTKTKMLLYDCSLNPNSVTPAFIEEIERFDLTTIRESESLNNLRTLYKGNRILFTPDPAFVMKPENVPLPSLMKNSQCIGINLSNLILRDSYGAHKEVIFSNYYKLIDNILSTSDMGVVLIPHVMKNQDLSVLKHLYKRYTDNDRVYLIENEDISASQLKYIISKFRFLVTARTHASIAAYSSMVPTLVIGYSVKSRGIAKDIFGQYNNYVIPINQLTHQNDLWEKFQWLIFHEVEIQKHLSEIMLDYKTEAMSIGPEIKKLLIKK